MSDKIISSNSKICKNTILYFLGMQIPENYKYLINFQINLKKLINSGQYFNQIVTPNFSDLNYNFKKTDIVYLARHNRKQIPLNNYSLIQSFLNKELDIFKDTFEPKKFTRKMGNLGSIKETKKSLEDLYKRS